MKLRLSLAATLAASAATLSLCATVPAAAQSAAPAQPVASGPAAPAVDHRAGSEPRACHGTFNEGSGIVARNRCLHGVHVSWTDWKYSPHSMCVRAGRDGYLGPFWNVYNARTRPTAHC